MSTFTIEIKLSIISKFQDQGYLESIFRNL